MKKASLLAAICTTMIATASAQSSLLLSDYRYKKTDSVVAGVFSSDSLPYVWKLKGKGSAWLYFNSRNELCVKPGKSASLPASIEVTITGTYKKNKLSGDFLLLEDNFAKNKVVAHRGAWKNTGATENSIASLQHAIDMKCQGSEFDVHMTADSALVIHHDPEIEGLKIATATVKEVFAKKLSNGETIPTLRQYIAAGLKQFSTELFLEIKSNAGPEHIKALTDKCVAEVVHQKAQAWTTYISFDTAVLKRVLELDPFAQVSYLKGDLSPEQAKAYKFTGLDYHYSVFQKHPEWIAQAQQLGLSVNAWTVNESAIMDSLLQAKVDLITTNEPEMLMKKK
ncbi:MAG: glycerophosphodiester phosphodiesterase family protein [Chitinophagaceae bacterium]